MTNEVLHDLEITCCSGLTPHTLCHSALWPDGAQFLEVPTSGTPCPFLCSSFCLPCSLPSCLPQRQLTIHPSRPVPDVASFSNVLMTMHLHSQELITLSAWSHKALYFTIGLTYSCKSKDARMRPAPSQLGREFPKGWEYLM